MSSTTGLSLRRELIVQRVDAPTVKAYAQGVLRLLLAQDGSTTRLCEAIADGPVSLHVLHQRVVHTAPDEVLRSLPGPDFIERVTCLAAHGQVMMDNLSYIALDGLPDDLRRDLEVGTRPIGHLLARLWVRRAFLDEAAALHERLWSTVGQADPQASRAYTVSTPEGPRMVIAETFRRGMLMG
jgi:chorismate-pyruvate lyase